MKRDLDIVALAKAECEAMRKAGKDISGAVAVAEGDAGTVDVEITGFVNVRMLEDLTNSVVMAGKDMKQVNVRINSPGGSAFAGVAIANYLSALDANVTTVAESAAMSAAAVIFMSGDERLMGPKGSVLMFHNAMGWIDILSFGNRKALDGVDVAQIKAAQIDVLDALDEIILSSMVNGTKLKEKEAAAMMAAEKNITNAKALEYGLATGVAGAAETEEPSEEEEARDPRPAYDHAEDVDLMAGAYAILNEVETH